MVKYHKLVRDRIPQIIKSQGKQCITQTLTDKEYQCMLDEKLREELEEYLQDHSLEEMADLLEVMHAAMKENGYTWEQLEEERIKKCNARGGFEEKIMLLEVSE